MKAKISIITISYNSEKTIEKTIKSVLFQKYRPLEYIFVDGNSKDETLQIIKKYIPKLKDKGIEVSFKSEPDKGISDAFNKGIQRATGNIIGIINSDDCLEEDALNYIVEGFDNNTDVVCGDCLWIDKKRQIKYVRKSKLKLNKLKYDMVLMHPTCFVKRKAYEKYGMFDISLKYVMDKDLMARFYRNGATFKYIPKIIAVMSSGGASDANVNKVVKEGMEVAIRNGVPKWKATIISKYKIIRLEIIQKMKKFSFILRRNINENNER